jgi:hypothetical protein
MSEFVNSMDQHVLDEVFEIKDLDLTGCDQEYPKFETGEPIVGKGMSTADLLRKSDFDTISSLKEFRKGDTRTIVILCAEKDEMCDREGYEDEKIMACCNDGCVITLFPTLFDHPVRLRHTNDKIEPDTGEWGFLLKTTISVVLIHELTHLGVYGGKSHRFISSGLIASLVGLICTSH